MPGRDYQGKPNPGQGTPFDWVKPHKPVPDWLRSLPPIPFEVPRWDKERSEGGACPITDISDKRRGKWLLRVNRYGISVALRHRSRGRVAGENTGLRRSMARSLSRLSWATHVLEHHGVRPTHMITLTLPPEAWEKVIEELGRDEAVQRFLKARAKFLDALRQRLRRAGGSTDWLWFLEFQRRGAPHTHILLDLGGYLPDEAYKEWTEWITAEWSRTLGVPAPYATRFERLKKSDFRYARKYAAKPKQKGFPFPARWGRSWGIAGYWRELLRESRHTPTSTYEFSTEELYLVLRWLYESVQYQIPVLRVFPTIEDMLTGQKRLPPVYRGRLALPPHWAILPLVVISECGPVPLEWDTS